MNKLPDKTDYFKDDALCMKIHLSPLDNWVTSKKKYRYNAMYKKIISI